MVGVCALAVLATLTELARPQDPVSSKVRVSTTGNASELLKTIPITRAGGDEKRVVMSMTPDVLPSLKPGDLLKATAEVMVTLNCRDPQPRCVGPVYHYNPIVRARLLLAKRKSTTGGRGGVPIAKPEREACRQKLPDREHHCVLVFTNARQRIDPEPLPCPLSSCHLNLVLDAHHPEAGRGDLLMVGGNRPDGTIPQDKGRINAIRIRPAKKPDARVRRADRPVRRRIAPDLDRRVVYSQRLGGLNENEQLAVRAAFETEIAHLDYNTRVTSQLILSDRRRRTTPGRFVRRVASLRGEIGEANGSNCTQREGSCVYRKVGVVRMKEDAIRRGERVPLFVNLITLTGPKHMPAERGDRIRVGDKGGLRVVRYPARIAG